MDSFAHDCFSESRQQAVQSAAWLRRCNGAMLGVMLAIMGCSLLLVVATMMASLAGISRHSVGLEDTPLIALCIGLVLAFAWICLSSYRRGVDDLTERERWLVEIDALRLAERLAAEGGDRQLLETALANTSVVNAAVRAKLKPLAFSENRAGSSEEWKAEERVLRFEDVKARSSRGQSAARAEGD